MEVLEDRPGLLVFRVNDETLFRNEAGGHRWQRIPPTEKRGRVQTSTVTVAVLPEMAGAEMRLNPADLEWQTTRGSGPGGQNRNKVETAVVLKHKPTGTMVRIDTGRSQYHNREQALRVLRARLAAQHAQAVSNAANRKRRKDVGSGMRGDKRRTIRVRDGVVSDHVLGLKMRLSDYLNGELPRG